MNTNMTALDLILSIYGRNHVSNPSGCSLTEKQSRYLESLIEKEGHAISRCAITYQANLLHGKIMFTVKYRTSGKRRDLLIIEWRTI